MRAVPKRLTDGRVLFATFLLAAIVYGAMVLGTLAELQRIAGAKPFDLRPGGYDFADATAFIAALGPDGRALYLWRQLPLDTLYPGLFALVCAGAIHWFSRPLRDPLRRWLRAVAPLAYLAALADYLENILIARMLVSFPDLPEGLVRAASTASMSKSVLTTVVMTALLIAMISYGARHLKRA